MSYEVIDNENKVVKITCSLVNYSKERLDEFIVIAKRMGVNKILICIN